MRHLILRLKDLNQKQLEEVYKNCFNTDAGQLVLEDLKGRFHEYVPPNDDKEVGELRVLMHIRNMLNPLPEELTGEADIGQGHSA